MGRHAELVLAMSLVLGTATVAWLVLAWPLRLWPRASVRFALANAQLGISLQLVLLRGEQTDWRAWALADLVGLSGFFLLHGGVRHLFGMKPWHRLELVLLAAVVLAYLLLAPGPASRPNYRLIYSLCAGSLCAAMAWLMWVGTRSEINRRAAWVFALPFMAMSGVMAWRVLSLPLMAPASAPLGGDRTAVVWAIFMLCLMLNMTLASCVITRLLLMIRRHAERDPLTGLFNRRVLMNRLAEERARSTRSQQPFALVMLDIDHFKGLNDRHGHAAGDAALQHVSAILQAQLRRSDVLARSGGEEFVVLMPETPRDAAARVAERMRVALESQLLDWQGQALAVRASFGVSDSRCSADDTALFSQTDAALYRAKAEGRNRVALTP